MKEWARIVVVNDEQVLFYTEYDSVEDEEIIHQIYKTKDGLVADMKISSKEEGWKERVFNKVATEEQAEKVINAIKKLIGTKPPNQIG